MKPPLYIRHVIDEERAALEAGLHNHDAFTVRRCQILSVILERYQYMGERAQEEVDRRLQAYQTTGAPWPRP